MIIVHEDRACVSHGGGHKLKLVFLADMYVLLKGCHLPTKLNGITSHKTVIFTSTARNFEFTAAGNFSVTRVSQKKGVIEYWKERRKKWNIGAKGNGKIKHSLGDKEKAI
jgi:hypothetical protein